MKLIYKSLIVFAVALSGCDKTIDVDIPMGKFTNAAVYGTDDLAQAGMKGVYATMTNAFSTCPFEGALSTTLCLSADEMVRASANSTDQQQLADNNLLPSNGTVVNLWAVFYNYVYQANMVYENVENSPGVTLPIKDRLMGEARFIRALSLFYLTNLYGNIPLTLTSDYQKNAVLHVSSQQEVYAQIVQDLKYAQSKLGAGNTAVSYRYRPNKWAATALLARVYLYTKDWANAEKEAGDVIAQNGIYKLDALENVFNLSSTEAIWALANAGSNIYTGEGGAVTGSNATNSQTRLTPYFLSQFSSDDQRLLKWTRASVGVTPVNTAPSKYKTFSNTQAGAKVEASMVLRLAEQYLIRAEARAMQNNITGAIDDVDMVRKRAGAVGDASKNFQTIRFSNPGIQKADMIEAIYTERMTELFSEYGHRWFDAKRSGKTLANFFGTRKTDISETDAFFPIPEKEIAYNPNIKQNDGY